MKITARASLGAALDPLGVLLEQGRLPTSGAGADDRDAQTVGHLLSAVADDEWSDLVGLGPRIT
jgi:hypothetical protein